MAKVLVIAAHADDEALGCGGAMAAHAAAGDELRALFMTDGVSARGPDLGSEGDKRMDACRRACALLGAPDPVRFDLPDNRMDSVPLLEIVQRIEPFISAFQPDVVYTHHAGDLNVDHRLTHEATMTALRPQPGAPAPTILSFEVMSSSEWRAPRADTVFAPNWFVDISDTLETKLAALEVYAEEMRSWPHSRSIEALAHLARWRGATMGVAAAEGFMLARRIERIDAHAARA